MTDYTNPVFIRFVKDMEEAEIDVRDYSGRNFYKGPAVVTSRSDGLTVQDVIRATNLKLQMDNMGLDHVLYPVENQKLPEDGPTERQHTVAKKWMIVMLQKDPKTYQDSAGEWNCTLLAEDCANIFDIYENENFDIPEWVFDLAVDVTEDFNDQSE